MKINIYNNVPKYKNFNINAINEYKKRISIYSKVETKKLLSPKKNNEYLIKVVVNSPKSSNLISSIELSDLIKSVTNNGFSTISFDLNITQDNNNSTINYDKILHLSSLQISFETTELIMYEQLYRAYTIINNKTYHK